MEKNNASLSSARHYLVVRSSVVFFLGVDLDLVDFAGFFFGTLAPFLRASESPIAMACFLLVTFLPDLPLFNVPFFRLRIAFSTFSDALLPYFAIMHLPYCLLF